MAIYILPTNDIVKEFMDFESMFIFYEGGVKGIIKDTVLLSEASQYGRYASFENKGVRKLMAKGLMDKILSDYSNSAEAVFLRYSENTSSSVQIELVTELIDNAVSDMMNCIFVRTVYDICKTRWEWIGNDLITNIRIIPNGRNQY